MIDKIKDNRKEEALGQNIRQARIAHGYSQEELAFMIGTGQSAISKIERLGLKGNNIQTIRELAKVLSVSFE